MLIKKMKINNERMIPQGCLQDRWCCGIFMEYYMKNKILVIMKEKDSEREEGLFSGMGADVYFAKNMQDAMSHLSFVLYQLILIAGFGNVDFTCRVTQAARKMQKAPMIILGAESMDERLLCIKAGADVALSDVCSNDEIELQALALMRRYAEWTTVKHDIGDVLKDSPLTLDSISRKVFWKDQELKLTSKEFDFLYLLASDPGRVYTFEQIYQNVWREYNYGDISNIIWCLIRRLREKLREIEPKATGIINSVRNVGYYFELHKEEYK